MREKLVKRYYCDFCKKTNYSKGTMRSHEEHCTMNLNRVCRVCKMTCFDSDHQQADIEAMKALLPNPPPECSNRDFDDEVNAALPKLREMADNCPACIMAALRQKGIPVPAASDFYFTKEMNDLWKDININNFSRE